MELLVGQDASRVWAGTFHHIGNRLLRRSAGLLGYQSNFTILDGEDQLDLIRLAMDDAGLSGTTKMAPKPAVVHHFISYSANVARSDPSETPATGTRRRKKWSCLRAVNKDPGRCRSDEKKTLPDR